MFLKRNIFFACLLFSGSCSSTNDDISTLFNEVYGPYREKRISYKINPNGWTATLYTEKQDELFYSFEKESNDTTEFIALSKSKVDDKVRINSYIITIESPLLITEIAMKLDTSYYFTQSKGDKKIFHIGEYNYRFSYAILKYYELDYYFMYKDSLGKIRGTDLPKLPLLTKKEQKIFNKKYK